MMNGQYDEGNYDILSGGTKLRTKGPVQTDKIEGLRQTMHIHHSRAADNW